MKHRLNTWLVLAALCLTPLTSANAALKPFYESSPYNGGEDRANLGLFLFIHDQVTPKEQAGLADGYLEWFLKHLEEVTGRRTVLTIVTKRPGITDFPYRSDNQQALMFDWFRASQQYANDNNLPSPSERHKYMLLTTHKVDLITHGLATPDLNVGIASMKMYHTLAHEVGHLLGATHEDARFLPCQTIMWGDSGTSLNSCYRFSPANMDNIRRYLSDVP